eukprot:1159586-Pelagomonas_calceolata.AAC.12
MPPPATKGMNVQHMAGKSRHDTLTLNTRLANQGSQRDVTGCTHLHAHFRVVHVDYDSCCKVA